MLALAVLASFLFLIVHLFLFFTKAEPRKGGEYTEGILGQPSFINPVLSQASEADSDLAQLIFSGLLKYNSRGEAVPDLAERYEVSEDGKVYTIKIKENVKWHDNETLKADDVIFTILTVQDPAFKSPLRQNWQGVEAEKIDDYLLKITLKSPYSGFAENLTMGIIPKHIWENIAPDRFYLSEYNLRPIGSGPYRFFDFQKDSQGNILSYKMRSFPDYYDSQAFITKFNANFYLDEDSLLTAYSKKEIDGMGTIGPARSVNIKAKASRIYEISLPRYFAVFLNQTKSVALASDKVREALTLATDRNEIIEKVLIGKGTAIYSPVLPQMKGYDGEAQKSELNVERAVTILEEEGWKIKEDDNVRTKDSNKMEIEILTLDWPELVSTAEILKEQWAGIGAQVTVNALSVSDLQQNYIRPREYPALLFGQAASFNPDFYSFWHSSQTRDPGLNLALFDDKKADEILERLRENSNEEKRMEDLHEFQKILAAETPAIFLYSPTYLYPVSSKVKGIEIQNINSPSWRFSDVSKWYIKTKRVRK